MRVKLVGGVLTVCFAGASLMAGLAALANAEVPPAAEADIHFAALAARLKVVPLPNSIVFFPNPLALGQASDAKAEAHAVDEHYNHLRSLQTEFTEVYRGSGVERTESGTLWLKKPGKMRWEYRSPREKLFVSDGKSAWFYVPGDRQARRTPAKKLDDLRSPLALLLGKTKLEKELHGLSLAPDVQPLNPGDVVLRGVPRGMEDRVSEILLEVTSEHRLSRIVISEVDGSVTEYRFTESKEDVAISEQRFLFSPPAGTETVEGELGP